MTTLTEAVVEQAALEWLCGLGWQVLYGPDIAADMPNAERDDYGQVVLDSRLRDAPDKLNPTEPVQWSTRCSGFAVLSQRRTGNYDPTRYVHRRHYNG